MNKSEITRRKHGRVEQHTIYRAGRIARFYSGWFCDHFLVSIIFDTIFLTQSCVNFFFRWKMDTTHPWRNGMVLMPNCFKFGMIMEIIKKDKEFYPKSRREWRKWLEKNHGKQPYVWLIMYKKDSGHPSVYYEEAVEEALCFGWIDSKPNKRDEESRFQFFGPRKPKSGWSAVNKKRITELTAAGKMTKAGLDKIELAKKNGSWTALDSIEALEMPATLQKAFAKNKKALKHFEAFPPSTKKALYQWVQFAKTDVTRNKRILEIVNKAAENIRANEWKPKKNIE